MKANLVFSQDGWLTRKIALLVFTATAGCLLAVDARAVVAAANIVIWDTGSRLARALDADERADWKAVPTELFALEAEPAKAASDPGYYGREYAFSGDAVVENHALAAVFSPGARRVIIYAKEVSSLPVGATPPEARLGRKIVEFSPLQTKTPTAISHVQILRNARDEAALRITFSAPGTANASAVFVFDRTEIVEIRPDDNMKRVALHSAIEYGVVPDFIGDDLIYGGSENASTKTLCVPCENMFVGLLQGADAKLVMTWPTGQQQMRLQLDEQQGRRSIESIEFDHAGQSFYLAGLAAPGIWHKESLAASYLEKDIAIKWNRPFPAKWKTQLYESKVKTTFAFRATKDEIWRAVPGSYEYPVWFDGDDAFFHLSKKVPPKGESLIYFLEAQGTPLSVSTPVDTLKATLGRQMCDSILDVSGRKLRTHHRRGGEGVHRACTCGYTEAIQAVFQAGEEVVRKEYVATALDDMIFFVEQHLERIDEYRHFAADMISFLQAKQKTSPQLKPYLEKLEQIVEQFPEEYTVQKENLKSLTYADELTRQTLALTKRKDANNLESYMERFNAWREMGGAQDYIVARYHMIARQLCQEAGYGCVEQQAAAALAEEIRDRCRQVLRNPDGYEIWADY